jgi:hypothetical protein
MLNFLKSCFDFLSSCFKPSVVTTIHEKPYDDNYIYYFLTLDYINKLLISANLDPIQELIQFRNISTNQIKKFQWGKVADENLEIVVYYYGKQLFKNCIIDGDNKKMDNIQFLQNLVSKTGYRLKITNKVVYGGKFRRNYSQINKFLSIT